MDLRLFAEGGTFRWIFIISKQTFKLISIPSSRYVLIRATVPFKLFSDLLLPIGTPIHPPDRKTVVPIYRKNPENINGHPSKRIYIYAKPGWYALSIQVQFLLLPLTIPRTRLFLVICINVSFWSIGMRKFIFTSQFSVMFLNMSGINRVPHTVHRHMYVGTSTWLFPLSSLSQTPPLLSWDYDDWVWVWGKVDSLKSCLSSIIPCQTTCSLAQKKHYYEKPQRMLQLSITILARTCQRTERITICLSLDSYTCRLLQ